MTKQTKTKEGVEKEAAEKPEEKKVAASKKTTHRRRTKTKELEERIARLEQERDQLKDRLLRLAADFENYKKITSREIENRIRNANEELIVNLLPILDDLERSLEAGKKNHNFKSFYEGVEMIYNNFKKQLERFGVEPVDSVGKPFDVDLHEALMMVEDKEAPPNTVLQEHQKAYRLNGKVIRHAKVVISK